ncbi:MAG: DnaD domain protein, partial [bacterium]
QKFNQIFNRELSVEFYEKMLKIYSDTKILFKALRVAEEKGDKPCYLLKILKDWQKEGLTSVSSINDYLKERQDKKQNQHSNKSYPNKNTKSVVPDRSLEEMYEDGWK